MAKYDEEKTTEEIMVEDIPMVENEKETVVVEDISVNEAENPVVIHDGVISRQV